MSSYADVVAKHTALLESLHQGKAQSVQDINDLLKFCKDVTQSDSDPGVQNAVSQIYRLWASQAYFSGGKYLSPLYEEYGNDQRINGRALSLLNKGYFEYTYFGYFDGTFGTEKPQIDEVFYDLLSSFRKNLESAMSEIWQKKVRISAKSYPIREQDTLLYHDNLPEIVNNVLKGNLLVFEPAFGSIQRLRRASLVRIGQTDLAGIVAPKRIGERFRNEIVQTREAELNEGSFKNLENISPIQLSEVLDFCVRHDVALTTYSGISSSDKLEDEVFSIMKSSQANADFTRLSYRRADSLKEVSKLILSAQKFDNTLQADIGILDLAVARQIWKTSRQDLNLFLMKFPSPLEVGYFYSKGDEVIEKTLSLAIAEALISNKVWRDDFISKMSSAGVRLDDATLISERGLRSQVQNVIPIVRKQSA